MVFRRTPPTTASQLSEPSGIAALVASSTQLLVRVTDPPKGTDRALAVGVQLALSANADVAKGSSARGRRWCKDGWVMSRRELQPRGGVG